MRFEGIQRTCRTVRREAVRHGWVVASETRAGTESRYLELARGSQFLKLRVSDHLPTRDCDVSVSPTEESIEEAIALLSKPPIFNDAKEASEWFGAMRARHLWAEYERASQAGEDGLAELKARAERAAPRNAYLVARGDGRLHSVDHDWLERVSNQLHLP